MEQTKDFSISNLTEETPTNQTENSDMTLENIPVIGTSDNSEANETNSNESFDCPNLAEFYSTELSERQKLTKERIEKHRWYYLKNQKNDVISIKKSIFMKYKNDEQFIGFVFTNEFDQQTDLVILLTQWVNEKEEMKKIGRILFYREVYLHTHHDFRVKKLFKNYIGLSERTFINDCKELVEYYRWNFKVHRNRMFFIKNRILSLDDKINITSIRNYDDVYECAIFL